jgi:serine/threonine protein kinase
VPQVDELSVQAGARVGRILKGKWRLDALLGIGGMAAVYAATHRNGNRIAVKMLHPQLSNEGEIRERFLREAYVANSVGHPDVISIQDDEMDEDGAVFLVMELLEGETVEARFRRVGRLGVQEALWVADRVLDVLTAAHAKGVVHRDLKPENLFITRKPEVKVMDFGIAHLRESSQKALTRQGAVMGTPAFMPPEQARGQWQLVDAQSDLWAVGATMFTLLSGRHVHQATTLNERLLAAMTQQAPSLSSLAALPCATWSTARSPSTKPIAT